MKKMMLGIIALIMVCGSALPAQDIAGNWQGTLQVDNGVQAVLKISKADNGGWSAMMYSVYLGPDGMSATSIILQGSTLQYSIDAVHGRYEGKFGADGASISGTWTQNGATHPLDLRRATKELAMKTDSSPHTVQFITVEKNVKLEVLDWRKKDVKLEVLDWGGTGRPLVFLTGLGNTAHIFDNFAPKFTSTYHVYGITRRGFGASSVPAPANWNYSADRLGDDVLAVIDALNLNRPVLVGHSIAGQELSSIGSRYPEKVAGLIYLEAAYSYAYYDPSRGNLQLDAIDLKKKLDQLLFKSQDRKQLVQELQTSLPRFENELQEDQKHLASMPAQPPRSGRQLPPIPTAIMNEGQKYSEIKCPVLAIFADPNDLNPDDRAAGRAKAFQAVVPSAHVVILPNADHYVFRSDETGVLREMNAFLAKLP